MPLHWTPTTLALVDDAYDKANASDGRSRYGAYLAQHPQDFTSWDPEPLTAAEFAVAAWAIATSPIMSPGYVRIRPDLAGVTVRFPDDDAGLIFRVAVPLLHSDLAAQLPYWWQDWGSTRRHVDEGPHRGYIAPEDRHPAILATAAVRITIDETLLPIPKHVRGPGLLDNAQEAVRTLAELVNDKAGPAVAMLRERKGGEG